MRKKGERITLDLSRANTAEDIKENYKEELFKGPRISGLPLALGEKKKGRNISALYTIGTNRLHIAYLLSSKKSCLGLSI